MSHSRPCHPMLFTVPPVLQTKASSLSAGTKLGAAATAVSSLYWQGPSFSTTLIYWGIQTLFSPQQTVSLPFLPSLSALPVPPVRVILSELSLFDSATKQRTDGAANTLSFSLSLISFSHSFTLGPV